MNNKIYFDENAFKRKSKNIKKILCQNIINVGSCSYGDKCLYAHNLDEQNIDYNRKIAYDILKSSNNLSDIILQKNHTLYKTLIGLTKPCDACLNHKCTGGYNCKFGSVSKQLCICLKDLNYGKCDDDTCVFLHLSKRGLKPFYVEYKPVNGTLLTLDLIDELTKQIQSNIIVETVSNENITKEKDCDIQLDSSSDEEINTMLHNSDSECDQSIFD